MTKPKRSVKRKPHPKKQRHGPRRAMRLPAVLARVGVSKTTLYEHIKAGIFPPPAHICKSAIWDESEIDAVLERAFEVRDAKAETTTT